MVDSVPMAHSPWAHTFSKTDKKETEKIYNLPLLQAFKKQLLNKVSFGEIGIEIECEGTHLFNTPIRWWSCSVDHSLRAVEEHSPIEYVLRKPILRTEVPEALSYLVGKLRLAGSDVRESSRTSVHVHINVQDLSIKQIYQFICLYLIFEEILVDFSGPTRPGNLFCLRAKDAEYFITVMENAIVSENFNEFFSNDLRYTSCNTAAIGKFGSLEFRSMRGTVDQTLIQQWIDILLLLKDKALTYNDPRAIVEDFHVSRPEVFFDKTFDSRQDLKALFQDRIDKHTSMWDGLRLMRDVACAIKWEKPLVKKKEHTKNEPLSPPSVQTPQPFDNAVITPYNITDSYELGEEGVWVETYSSGERWLCNYNNYEIANFNWSDNPDAATWIIQPRTAYLLNDYDNFGGLERTL